MENQPRVSLLDPMLYQSTYINPNPPKVVKINFWKKFSPLNFMINIGIPLAVFIFVLFILKEKYLSKLQKTTNKKKITNNESNMNNFFADQYQYQMPVQSQMFMQPQMFMNNFH